ncbi:MAG: rod-binding protein [Sphingomonadales bacterium]|nr:rod-binding protein [Sphingomonadales bacterium]MDE2169734.1 rod-binding protein [Sphingomonadales bacterium]
MAGTSPSAAMPTDAKKLHQVAQQFEAIFVRQMLAEARKSNMGDTLFNNQGTDTFREMQEQTFATLITKQGGLGFAKLIEKQLTAQMARIQNSAAGTPAGNGAATTQQKG